VIGERGEIGRRLGGFDLPACAVDEGAVVAVVRVHGAHDAVARKGVHPGSCGGAGGVCRERRQGIRCHAMQRVTTAEERAGIMAWRREERQRLIAARLAMSVAERQAGSAGIIARLDRHCRAAGLLRKGVIVSGYWPLRGEPDMRPWLTALHAEGAITVMPVVVAKGEPLRFRRWTQGCAMEKGFWDIPVPADPAEYTPQLLLAPVVGFDAQCYRLGYGGGYFDRTLALLCAQRLPFQAIGVGYESMQLPSIHPLPHDIVLHGVITESVVRAPAPDVSPCVLPHVF
jgi:5-formyltetrahydrofolate cyclo-ligase